MGEMMEGSMKTMSRSRYHALAWSFMRIRGHRRGGGVKRTRHAGRAVATAAAAAGREGGAFRGGQTAGLLARASQSVITIFRTEVLPRDTDI
jgi:hypothetical protein